MADCEVLLSVKEVLAGTGKLNWSVNLDVRDWDGITIGESRNRVTGLDLSDRQLTGRIPAELSKLPYLTKLRLSGNQLTGRIPAELGSLSYLTALWLNDNQLAGEIPAELGNLVNLTWLSLGGNQLTGEIPVEFGNLTRLAGLGLMDNQLTGEIPVEFGNLTNLKELLLAANQLTGRIPTELGELLSLRALSLGDNAFHGCVPEMLRDVGWNDLQELRLEFCGMASSPINTPTEIPIPKGATVVDNVINSSPLSHTSATIGVGDFVRWTNNSNFAHTVSHTPTVGGQSKLFDAHLQSNDSFAYQFNEPGEYRYACLIHPVQMWAIITVTR